MIREIPLSQGKTAIVDAEDYDKLIGYSWYFKGGRYAYRGLWIAGSNRTKHIPMHHDILKAGPGQYVDHINGNGLDNRKANLRIVSHQQNMFNMKGHKSATSKFKGVSWCSSRQKWAAHICKDGKTVAIGRFKTEKAAAVAYNSYAERLFGNYAHLNIVD